MAALACLAACGVGTLEPLVEGRLQSYAIVGQMKIVTTAAELGLRDDRPEHRRTMIIGTRTKTQTAEWIGGERWSSGKLYRPIDGLFGNDGRLMTYGAGNTLGSKRTYLHADA
jgi:hypothetical protein